MPFQACIYSKIDLHHAYHLVRISKGNKWKTAFKTHYESFKWLVIPFSLTNSPVAFQWFMNAILEDLLDHCIVVYLDDILVYSDDPKQHWEHVRELFWWLHKHSHFAKANKCKWYCDSVEFLGYILTTDSLTWPTIKSELFANGLSHRRYIKDIQSFLGFVNFYCCFIFNYSDITIPLVGESAIIRLKTATAADQKAWGHAIDFVFLF